MEEDRFPHPRGDGLPVQAHLAALPAGADWGAVKKDITASLKLLETGSNFDPEQTNDLLWRVLAQEGMIDYGSILMKPLLDEPLREALSARPLTTKKSQEDTLFISYPSSAYRDFLDGKGDYPGLAALAAAVRREEEMGE